MGQINTFTNRMFPNISLNHLHTENFNDDANWAYKLAEMHGQGFNHQEVNITPQIVADYWDDSIYYMEQPVYNPSLAMYCYTNKVLHDNGIVVTMAGDMGDEILGGYPKYWKLRKKFKSSSNTGRKIEWIHIIDNWIDRIKRPLKLHSELIDRTELREELLKCYPDDIWNPDDPVGSYMALDCTASVPEEFLNRNDKYGMAYGMEGRFPLASKTFMQYCMDIHSDVKIMHDKADTKILTKQAYAGKLPKGIINKLKTGWTVPIQFWCENNYPELKKLNCRSLEISKACQGHGKAMIPAMIARDWTKLYQMKKY